VLRAQACSRRTFLRGAVQTAAIFAAQNFSPTNSNAATIQHEGDVEPVLAQFIERYMQAMYAPGLILGLVHADGQTTAAAFGLSDVARNRKVRPEMLFQIGSISKSFCALTLLQMRDEGKLDLHAPILEYLPWLPIEAPYGVITTHHLLTHSSGLPGDPPIFLSDRNMRHKQTFKPGTQFHYSNLGFDILGQLAASLDQRPYAAVLQARILDPLGMKTTYPAISNAIRAKEAQSYVFFRDDLNVTRDARLEVAPREVFDGAAGCIASTAADMTRYMTMLLKRGEGPEKRIVSAESFELFATPHVESVEFGPGSHYGYGIAIDLVDGHKLLKHTGGMNSFASSMQVDLQGRVAAFASINAMQGYRPNPVTKYALQIMSAEAEKKPLPQPDAIDNPRIIENAAEYAGNYSGDSGSIDVLAEGKSLVISVEGKKIRLQRASGDNFVAEDEAWQEFSWLFLRGDAANGKAPVTELIYGTKWYVNAAYTGPKKITAPQRYAAYAGSYDSGTDGFEVVICKGKLMTGNVTLEEIGDGLFRRTDEPNSPETLEFLHEVNGQCRMLLQTGVPYWRINT